MANERFYRAVLQAFTANGTADGVIQVQDAHGFKVKASVVIKSNTQNFLTVEIKAIIGPNIIQVGPPGADMTSRSDLTAFLVADGAYVQQPKQKRPSIGPGEIDRAVYEEEPTVARRVVMVDQYGEIFTADNPIPIQATVDVQVDLDAKEGDNISVSNHPSGFFAEAADTITTDGFEEIFSYTSGNNLARVVYVEVSVSTPATVRLKLNGTVIRELRTSSLERNAYFEFREHRKLLNTEVLTVEAMVDRKIYPTYETFTALEGYLA